MSYLLDAVNSLLSTIGQTPIATLEGGQSPDVLAAVDLIKRTNSAVQSCGWKFNTEKTYTLNFDINGKVSLPTGVLDWKQEDLSSYPDLVIRSGYLYNQVDKTFIFTTPVDITVIWLVEFEDDPTPVRNYVIAKAAATFQERFMGSTLATQTLGRDLATARSEFMRWENEAGGYNMLNGLGNF
jgi:hypothetical protein